MAKPSALIVARRSGDEELCYDPVSAYGGAVILFSPSRHLTEVRDLAARRGLRYFALPIRWTEFRRLLAEAISEAEDA